MRIAINTRLLIENKLDGISRFSFETLKRITTQNLDIDFDFIFDRPYSPNFIFSKNITPHVLSPQTRHPILWYIWFEFQLPKLINKINPDLFFSPDGFMSTKLSIPTITTIHDINFEHRPKDLEWSHSLFYRKFFRKYAQLSKHIITVSKFSKKDIMKQYNIDEDQITVAYNGVSNIFHPIDDHEKIKIKNTYTNGKNFFVFIGSLHKRKNIKNLLLAFDIYRKKNGLNKLLIIGKKKWWDKETESVYKNMEFKKDISFLGAISDNVMAQVLASAQALCFTSFFEGFGLPIVESMKCHVPIITSNTSCMPEIAKNAALIINPHDVETIQRAMLKIEKNKSLRISLIKKGQERIKLFDWDITANTIITILKKYAYHN